MSSLDLAVLAAYAMAVLAIGRAASRRGDDERGLVLADRDLPTGAVFGSLVATELSAATFVGVPHASYTGDWSYLQLAFGALAGKIALAVWVIPLYHRLGVVTVYGFLGDRFGPLTQRAAALCFVVGRTFASGARLFIAGLAFAAASGLRLELAIVGCAAVAGIYTRWGGLRAVVWTDVLQGFVFAVGASAVLVVLAGEGDGLGGALAWAPRRGTCDGPAHRSLVHPHRRLALRKRARRGFFLTLATHATDHDMVQRLLAARDGRRGGRALWISALSNFPLTLLFLGIGTAIAHQHSLAAPAYDASDARAVLPLFALHELPAGVRGLVFAGLFAAAMSSLDSAICAIGATWIKDVAPRPADTPAAEAGRRARRVNAACCVALGAMALAIEGYQEIVQRDGGRLPSLAEFALSAMSILYGALLGVFAVGLLRPGGSGDRAARSALAVGGALGLALFLHPLLLGETLLAWGYWIPLTATVTAAVALAPRPAARPD